MTRIEKLRRDHPVDLFDCGQEALNRPFVRYARAFYERLGFVPAPTDAYHLFVLIKDVRAILK